ncbi:DNA cytosine methyltransferase [Niveispirillum sp.]|uniref:DNA cytosine methyltransferase n=1 Tax=Niveispirillum sp. TaxID=1917217 RepID=UPI001B6EDF14|nr:DNA cytosine methyltransferase [Niveispirillum sp.]MBP7337671.1 DNA cytosine methyltransferase [Niveispirillum sp.]
MDALFPSLPIARRPRKARTVRSGLPAGTALGRPWPLDEKLNVVLFAGVGGACQGMEEAGFPVGLALNHDTVAIAAHRRLNPHTRHLQADICEVDPLHGTGGRPVGSLWASPDCRDFSTAKGGAPRSPRVRSLPWQVCRWVGVLRKRGLGPETFFLENVREIRGWGPLIAKRDPATGRCLVATYSQDQRTGKPNRTPLIRVARQGERTPRQRQVLVRDPARAGRTYKAFCSHLRGLGATYEDRDLCCADYGVPTSRRRLFGIGRFDGQTPVWPTITHGHRDSADVPAGRLLPHVAAASIIDWSLPLPSIFDRDRDLVHATMKRVAVGTGRLVLKARRPFLVHLTHHGQRPEIDPDAALPTLTGAHRGEIALVGPTLVPTTHRSAGSETRIHDGTAPVPTLTAGVKGGEFAVMGAYLAEHRGASTGQTIDQAIGTQTAVEHHAVVGAWMVQHNTGVVGHSPLDATSTLTTTGTQQQVAGAFLVHHRGTGIATSPAGALRTVTTGGDRGGNHIGIGAAFLTEYYGTGGQHQEAANALNTLSTADRFAVSAAGLEYPPLTPAQFARARQVAEFLRSFGQWDGGDLVTITIGGTTWIVVDIGMRMLRPFEAAAAHELAMPDLITVPKLDRQGRPITGTDGRPVMITRPLTKTESMRLIGNSVPKRMARLLVAANSNHVLDLPSRAAVAAE